MNSNETIVWTKETPAAAGVYLVITRDGNFQVATFYQHSNRMGAAHWRIANGDRVLVVAHTSLPSKPVL